MTSCTPSDLRGEPIETARQVVAQFERATAPPTMFGHHAHVRLAWSYLWLLEQADAVARLRATLQAFARAAGKPDHYHETLTLGAAYLIDERRRQADLDWPEFVARNDDLFKRPGALADYYSESRLDDPAARVRFQLPDRAPDPMSERGVAGRRGS